MNTKRADFFLVIEYFPSRSEIYKKLSMEGFNHYKFLIFKDDALYYLLAAITLNTPFKKLSEAFPLCQDTCPLSNLSIQTKAGGGK